MRPKYCRQLVAQAQLRNFHHVRLDALLLPRTAHTTDPRPRRNRDFDDDNDMADAPTCKVILAGGVAKKLLAEVQDGLKQLNRSPLLVGFLASGDPASRVYADWTGKTAREK